MAGRSKVKSKKSHAKSRTKENRNGPVSPTTGQKHKSIAKLHGIEALSIQTPAFDEPISPRNSLDQLQQQQRNKVQLSEWMTIMKKTQGRMDSIEKGIPQSRQLLSDFEKVQSLSPAKSII